MVSANYSNKSRDEIRDEIVAEVKGLWDQWDSLPVSAGEYKSEKCEFEAKCIDKDGLTCVLSRGKFPGMTLEKHKEFRKQVTAVAPKMSPQAEVSDLPDTDGLETKFVFLNLNSYIVSNRNLINTYYEKDEGDSNFWMNSSRGNEALYEQHKDKIGSNVIATNHYQCDRFTPYDGGLEIHGAVLFDIAGSIPSFMASKGAARNMKRIERVITYIQTGEVMGD